MYFCSTKKIGSVVLLSASTALAIAIGCSRQESTARLQANNSDTNLVTSEVCKSGLDAFKTTLHPLLRANCVSCHTPEGTGPVHGPSHSVADPEASYRLVLKYLNPSKLENSRIVTKGGNMHCLDDYDVDCKTTSADILPLVKNWWDQGEKLCPHDLPIQSKDLSLPNPLPDKTGGFAKMRLKLQDIAPEYAGLFFEFEIQRGAPATPEHPGNYLIQRPRFFSNNGNWRVTGLQFGLNGEIQPSANVYLTLNSLVTENKVTPSDAAIWPEVVGSVQSAIVLETAQATDLIHVRFGDISKTTDQIECHDLEMFTTSVKPKMDQSGCQYCHGGHPDNPEGTAAAKERLSLDGNDEFICKQFARHGNKKSPMFAPILWFPMHGAPSHPLVIPFPEAVLPEWGDWLARGSQ